MWYFQPFFSPNILRKVKLVTIGDDKFTLQNYTNNDNTSIVLNIIINDNKGSKVAELSSKYTSLKFLIRKTF